MRLRKSLISIGISMTAFVYASNVYAQSGNKNKEIKPNKTLSVSALIFTDSVKRPDDVTEQFKFLNNGLPSAKRVGEDVDRNKKIVNFLVDDAHQSEAVRRLCFPIEEKVTRPKFVGTVLAFIAPKLIGLFVDEVDKGLEKEIAKYSKTHKKEVSIRPYAEGDDFKLRSSCFRYSRFTEMQFEEKLSNNKVKVTSERELEFDFIGQWKVIEGQHIRIRPLRLYLKTPTVPKDSKKVALAISAKASAVWRTEYEGHSKEIFNTIIHSEKLHRPEENHDTWTKGLKFYNLTENKVSKRTVTNANGETVEEEIVETDANGSPKKRIREDLNSNKSWANYTALPIIPFSEDFEPESAIANLEISVAEVGSGARKKVLKLARKGLSLFKDDITSVLEEAASELLEDEAPVVDTPDKYCATFTSIISEEGVLEGSAEWTGGNETCDDE